MPPCRAAPRVAKALVPVLLSESRPPPHGPRPQGGGSVCTADPHRPLVPAATAWGGAGHVELKIYASGKRVVVWDGLSPWQPDSGQFLLNFDTKQILQPARLKAPRREQPSQAEAALKWFDRAMVLQTDSRDEARRAYPEAIRLQPAFVEAHINLGLLHHNAGDFKEA